MKLAHLALAVPIALFACSSTAETSTAYDDVLAGKECEIREYDQVISCHYKVGKDLEFWIYGIGDPSSINITFARSNRDGDYFAVFNLGGCIIVRHGGIDGLKWGYGGPSGSS